MRKAMFFIPYTLCVAVILFLTSCGKDGDTGPAGATGDTGATGATGATGTANVIYSTWIDTTTWFYDSPSPGDTTFYADINAPKLTADILNSGEIKVYANFGTTADPFVLPLPYNGGSFYVDVFFSLSTISLASSDGLVGLPVRYILIPGGTPARSAKAVDWNNYKEVQKYLGLTD